MLQLHSTRDVLAVVLASAGALVTAWFNPTVFEQDFGSATVQSTQRAEPAGDADALRGLLDADQAVEAGAWWLDADPAARARLSFAPEHQRLVWQVSGEHEAVTLDAHTGEALGFDFE